MNDAIASNLAANLKQLRLGRGLTQHQVSRLAGVPRATWANLESGAANPTVSVLVKVAAALQVPIQEVLAAPRAAARLFPRGSLKERQRGEVTVRKLLPEPIPGMEMERMELAPGSRMKGIPHLPGTREYLACEAGEILLAASGQSWTLQKGDVLVFRGDQPHSYTNPGTRRAVGYSVVALAPPG